MVAAAAIGSAVISAGVTMSASSKASKAQTQAASQAAATEQMGIAEQRRQYDLTRADLAPWRETGARSLGTLADLIGVGAGGQPASGRTLYDAYVRTPDYQFRMDEGVRALDRSASARGRLLSGASGRSLTRYGQGLAAQGTDTFANRLASLAGIGQTATAQTGQFGANMASNIQSGLSNIANTQLQAGQARASSYLTGANAINTGINNLAYTALSGGFGGNNFVPPNTASTLGYANSINAQYPMLGIGQGGSI